MPWKKSETSKKNYFGPEIDQHIAQYISLPAGSAERDRLYLKIYPALRQLAQNVFYNRKICYYDDSPASAINDCVVFITERLKMYDITRNTNAFSYFNRTAINFFIQLSRKAYNKQIVKETLPAVDRARDFNYEEFREETSSQLRDFFDEWIPYMETNCNALFLKKEQTIAMSILNTFSDRNFFSDYDKKNIYIFIREQAKCSTQCITPVVKKMYNYYKVMKEEYDDVYYNFHSSAWDFILEEVKDGRFI